MTIKLANNASSTLATSINASDTGVVLTTGDGAEFPVLTSGDYFYATLTSTAGTQEIVKATARSGDSLTVVRAQESTTAQSFAAGARFELRVTAQSVIDAIDDRVSLHDQASEISFVPYANIGATNVQAAIQEEVDDLAATSGSSLVGFQQTGANATARNVQNKLRETISVKDFGAVGDGVADDTAAIVAARTAANDTAFVEFPYGTYKVTGTLEMPLKVSGNFTIDGNIKWSYKKEILQEGQVTVTGTILLDSVWFSKFNHLECGGNFTIYSSNPTWGVFWNDFGMIRCSGTMIIDVDQGQSVNQNNFYSCKCDGGIHIKGTSLVGIREAHNNVWFSVDTTGASLTATDGTTGCHLLNDSVNNQTNTVINWYAEATGGCLAKGNWNILGDNVDATSPVFVGGRYNYRLGARAQGRQSSYLPIAVNNASIGGDWSQLTDTGLPLQMTFAGAGGRVSLASISANAANSPDQSVQGLQNTGSIAFSNIQIQYQLTTSPRVAGTAYVYQEGNPEAAVEVYDGAGVLVSAGGGRLTPIGNNWYLLRIGSDGGTIDVAAGKVTGTIRIFAATAVPLTAADFRIITSFFVTTEAIAPIPSIKYGQTVGYGTAAPSAGTWKRGDICWNTTPVAGGVPGWVCVTAGTPGTWKAMANLAV